MISSALLSELNIAADPWSPSNDSIGLMYTLLELHEPETVLCLGASNASILASMWCNSMEASLHIVEEHEAILEHIVNKGGECMEYPSYQISSTIEEKVNLPEFFGGIRGEDLDVAEEYRHKHDMLASSPHVAERVTSKYSEIKKGPYDFIIVDGPRKSGLGRALVLDEDIMTENCVIIWMNGMHDNVIDAIKFFDHNYYSRSVTSMHLNHKDGIAVTSLTENEV